MTKPVTYEATRRCVTCYGILQRNHNVLWATYITNGYIQRLMFSWSRFFPTFSKLSTVRDVYQYHISVLCPYNGTCVYLYVYAWVPASYTVPQPTYALSKTVPVRHVRPWNGVYTARDSPGQPHMIVVTDKKLLKFERGHRATRWCNILGIQRIYGTVHVPDCRLGIYTIFFFFNLWV